MNFIKYNRYIFFEYVLPKTSHIFAWNIFLRDAISNAGVYDVNI